VRCPRKIPYVFPLAAAERFLTEPALHEALTVLLTGPAHAVTVIATTRVAPTGLLSVEPGAQRQLRLDEGLGSPDAETVLRALDEDGTLGLRDAPDELLDGLRVHTRGFPRALEAVKAILDGDRTLTPRDLLDRTRDLPEDRVVSHHRIHPGRAAGAGRRLLHPDPHPPGVLAQPGRHPATAGRVRAALRHR
jgi:hypothetical protein